MNIYNKSLSNSEIIKWVELHYKTVKKRKDSRFNTILSMIDSDDLKILDYGCGWGFFSKYLSDLKHQVTGIDLDKNEIDISRTVWQENEYLEFKKTQIKEIEDKSYDLVISSQVIEHVHNPGNYLSEINRVLKDEGELIISLPNLLTPKFIFQNLRSNLTKRLKRYNKSILNDFDKRNLHINAWDSLHFTHLISTVGFEIVNVKMCEGLRFPFNIYLRVPFFLNFSYTMCFKLKKVANKKINHSD